MFFKNIVQNIASLSKKMMFLQDVLGFRKSTKKQRYTSMASSLLKILDQGDLTYKSRNGYIGVPSRQYVSSCVSATYVCYHISQTLSNT